MTRRQNGDYPRAIMKLDQWLKTYPTEAATFAEDIGVSRQALHRYRTGARIPEQEIMQKIAEKTEFKVTANDFYGITRGGNAATTTKRAGGRAAR